MATSFADRLARIDTKEIKLYAGDEAPQAYAPEKLVCASKPKRHLFSGALIMGALIGAAIGYIFRTQVGLELFYYQALPVVYATVKSDTTLLLGTFGAVLGPVATLVFLIFSRTHTRILQFWSAYLAGSIAVNLSYFWSFYLTIQASW